MRYRRFGKTNLPLSVLSLGTMRCLASAEVAQQTIQRAWQAGINHIETASNYGKSEEYIGNALQSRNIPRSQIYLTSKHPPTADAQTMQRGIEQSLKRLQTDYLDCFAIHGVNTAEHLAWIRDSRGGMAAVEQAMAAGQIRHLGFSTHAPLELILDAIATDRFEFVNLHYYVFFQRHVAAIELAREKNLGIFIISPGDKGGQLYSPPQHLRDLCQPFTPLEITYRFLLSQPHITTLSVGAANPDELAAPLAIADRDGPLTEAESAVLHKLETWQTSVLGTEQCRQCYECLPCPEAINIPEVLRLRNLTLAYDMQKFGEYRYRMFENAGHWFPGARANRCTRCGDCLPRCPENLPIPSLLFDTHQRLSGPARRRLWD